MEWLQQNWIWIFAIAAMFLMMRRGGMSCCDSMDHGHSSSDRALGAQPDLPPSEKASAGSDAAVGKALPTTEAKQTRQHHGCC